MDKKASIKLSSVVSGPVRNNMAVPLTDDDIVIRENKRTRRSLRPSLAPNPYDATARVRIDLFHQCKYKSDGDWADVETLSLSKLHADEKARFQLGGRETKKLFTTLIALYRRAGDLDQILAESGLTVGDIETTVSVAKNQREIIQRWVDAGQDEVLTVLEEFGPDLLGHCLALRQYRERQSAIATFKRQLTLGTSDTLGAWNERQWETFFSKNEWIFGHGLAYQFLNINQRQPYYGGYGIDGRGGQRGDFLMTTEALARFVVLVEIKLPSTSLLSEAPARGDRTPSAAFGLHRDLSDAIGQLHTNCHTWSSQAYSNIDTARRLDAEGVYSYNPKSILVAGSLAQFDDEPSDRMAKLRSFELHRRGMHHPEIITYDELYIRATAIASFDAEKEGLVTGPTDIDDDVIADVDDLPF